MGGGSMLALTITLLSFLAGGQIFPNPPPPGSHGSINYEILGQYQLKAGSLSKTVREVVCEPGQEVVLPTAHGAEMQCAQECSKAECGAFYVQVGGGGDTVLQEGTCSLVPEDSGLGYKDTTNLAADTSNYYIKL